MLSRWRTLTLGFLSVTLTGVLSAIPARHEPEAHAADGTHFLNAKGVDSCAAPTTQQMQNFWYSPYFVWYIYIGGAMRACLQTNLNAVWVQQVRQIGWALVPVWVGPQAPCTGFRVQFSRNTTTAYDQGKAEEAQAYNALQDLGVTFKAPVVYDLEGFNTGDAGCVAAAQSFIQGWVDEAKTPSAQYAGVYGASCGSALNAYSQIARPPDFIWGAYWNGNQSTADLQCVPSGNWVYHQRDKQYQGGHYESYSGTTLAVDSDCNNSFAINSFDLDLNVCY